MKKKMKITNPDNIDVGRIVYVIKNHGVYGPLEVDNEIEENVRWLNDLKTEQCIEAHICECYLSEKEAEMVFKNGDKRDLSKYNFTNNMRRIKK